MGVARGFRHRARLAVRGTSDEPKIGLFQVGSHHIVDIPRCVIHHPLINQVVLHVKQALRETAISPYHDVTQQGLVRYLQLVVERSTQSVQLVIVGNCDSSAPLEPLLGALGARLGPLEHSLWFNANTASTNAILGSFWEHVRGPAAVAEKLGGVQVFFPPDAFGQANLDLFERILARIHDWVPNAQRVLEYYAGAGAIGLGLLRRSLQVDFVEVAPGGLAGLKLGLRALDESVCGRARLHRGVASEHCELARTAHVVIVDPPRKWLDPGLLRFLAETPPERLIYLSCGISAFERDTEQLLSSQALSLRHLVPFVLFPYSDHVETLALFERC